MEWVPDSAPPGTPAKKWQVAFRELGKQITGAVTSVPQATLARFGLIRPFGSAAEADHIQLLGSKY